MGQSSRVQGGHPLESCPDRSFKGETVAAGDRARRPRQSEELRRSKLHTHHAISMAEGSHSNGNTLHAVLLIDAPGCDTEKVRV